MMSNQKILVVLGCLAMCLALVCRAQDYDEDNYTGGGGGGNGGAQGNQGDNEQNGFGNDDSYNGNMPNYQQNVDSDSSNQNPASYPAQSSGGGSSGGDADGDYEGDDGSAAGAASAPEPSVVRVRRSAPIEMAVPTAAAPSAGGVLAASASEPKLRVKRHGKYYIGPVYTYVKTDKHANFKWGVKHKVGKKHHG